jgi:hypothetical protein
VALPCVTSLSASCPSAGLTPPIRKEGTRTSPCSPLGQSSLTDSIPTQTISAEQKTAKYGRRTFKLPRNMLADVRIMLFSFLT